MSGGVSATMSDAERAERLVDIAVRLIEILRQENSHLEARAYRQLTDTVAEKSVLLGNYETHMAYIQQQPGFAASVDTELLADLLESTRMLQELAETNRQHLRTAIEAGEMVLDLIVQAARKNDVAGYDAQGGRPTGNDASPPVSLNQRL